MIHGATPKGGGSWPNRSRHRRREGIVPFASPSRKNPTVASWTTRPSSVAPSTPASGRPRAVPGRLRPRLRAEGRPDVGEAGPADPPHPPAGRRRLQRPAVLPRPVHGGPHRRRRRPRCSCALRRALLGLGPRLRPRPDVLVSPGGRPGPQQRRRHHRAPGRACPSTCWPTSTTRPATARRTTSPPPSATGCCLGAALAADGRGRRPEGRLRRLQGGGPGRRAGLRARRR